MRPFNGQAADWRVLAGVAALHAAAALALLSMEPVARAVGLPKPLMVSLLASEPEPPQVQPKPLPPKLSPPRTEPVQRNLPPPILSVPEAAPAPRLVEAPLTPPEPLPAVLPPPAPEPVRPGPVAAYTPPAPAPMTPPRFDADYLDNPAPAYPALSRSLGEEGRVLLRVFVNPDGSAAQVEVRDGSGFERLDKVAGPVGEALIMTALGLAVAIPAVLAYNAFNRSNRLVLAELDGFAHDLFAFMSTGIHAEAPRRDGKLATPRPAAAPRTLAMEAR